MKFFVDVERERETEKEEGIRQIQKLQLAA